MTPEQIYQLRIIDQDENEHVFPLGNKLVKIGSLPESDLVLTNEFVSRNHATIEKDESGYLITDPGSSNGTFLNGEDIRKKGGIPLKHGDELKIDGYLLTFEVITSQPPPVKPPPRETKQPPPTIPPPLDEGLPAYSGEVPPSLNRYSTRLINYLPEIYQANKLYTNGTSNSQNGLYTNGVRQNGTTQNGHFASHHQRDEQDAFMSRYLAIFESILLPLEWTADGFDLFLDPATAPVGFLPWLASWFELTFDQTWSEEKRRELLACAYFLFFRRGTKAALSRILKIYTGQVPSIDDESKGLASHTFEVTVPVSENEFERELIERIINEFKPAHTVYTLKFKR